jgi:transposase InsO family protein
MKTEQALLSRSRARHTPPKPYAPEVIARILELRDTPQRAVPRKLGPKAILYYLHQAEDLKAKGYRLPRAASTVWRILVTQQRIYRPPKVEHQPFERPTPMDTWEIDFTDVGTAQHPDSEKKQHQVEAFGVIDRGTSLLVDLQTDEDYHAGSVILSMTSTFMQQGLPRRIVFDRDPRFVASWSAEDFPSAFMRFLLNLGIELDICPPKRPDLKPFIERYFRTLKEECIQVFRPATVQATQELFKTHRQHYNYERPHQSRVCQNQPPALAFPNLPRLASLPYEVDPDHWLKAYHGQVFKRRVSHNGSIQIDKLPYYIRHDLVGKDVLCRLDAEQKVFEFSYHHKALKKLPIKGLYHQVLLFEVYLDFAMKEALSERKRLQRKQQRRVS